MLRRLLQSFIHNRNLYDRPQDEWTCGRAAEGCPCIYGPGKKGECRATCQCQPARKGDRWVCTRQISLGGACATGPMPDGKCSCPVPPCRPKRSLRGHRRRLTWLAVLAALGGAILILGGRNRAEWNSPGPITSQHATSAQRCADCHTEPNLPPLTPEGIAQHAHAQNQLCLKCHDLGPQPAAPHGASATRLAQLTTARGSADSTGPAILAVARTLAPRGAPELACAACHSEHHGRDFDLKKVGSRECQACHQQQFDHFAKDHPQFTSYPYERRTRLQFDHRTHWQKHFSDPRVAAVAPTSCTNCHEPVEDGRQMRVKNFAQTCAACHADQIAGAGRAGDTGISFFQLPAFDLATLHQVGIVTGDYPEFAEGGLTPFMRWMLEGDPAASAALATLDQTDPAHLAQATPAQKAAAAQLLWSVKGLFADLATQGQEVLVRRLGATAKNDPATAARIGQLPADNIILAQQSWLPGLLGEVAAHRRGEALPAKPAAVVPVAAPAPAPVPAAAAAASDDLLLTDDPAPAASATKEAVKPATLEVADAEDRVSRGGWYRRDETYTLYYRPGGHADAFLTAWLDTTVRDATPTATAIFAQLSARDATGLCLKCHTVDDTPHGARVNWRTRQPQPEQHEFTKFKHAAHFSLVGDQGCMTCHIMDGEPNYPKSFGANRDPAVFHSNFVPITRDSCAACHRPGEAGMDCLLCHNYHTGEWRAPNVRASGFHPESVRKAEPAVHTPPKS